MWKSEKQENKGVKELNGAQLLFDKIALEKLVTFMLKFTCTNWGKLHIKM